MASDVEIRPLVTAVSVPRPTSALVMGGSPDPVVVSYLAYYVRVGGRHLLVDTGVSGADAATPLRAPTLDGPVQDLVEAVEAIGVAPAEIEYIINTHLHWDHCGNNAAFPAATVLVQRREVDYATTPLPVHRRGYAGSAQECWGSVGASGCIGEQPVRLVDGDVEVLPGLTILTSPGHTPGSQSVMVVGQRTYVLAGDNLPLFDNLPRSGSDSFALNPLYVDLAAYYSSVARVVDLADVVLPGHDGRVLDCGVYR